jgi:ubiquinone/menaquinone biosynthesis C-methylase UbiE
MQAVRSADEIREANTRYHDVAAAGYDTKWGIDGSEVGRGYDRALEIGAGTGYFSLNLLQAGVVREATCTDISPGMMRTLAENAARLGVSVRTARAEAESLPFPDASFDLVLGHAVLHHLPDLHKAFDEFHRVLRPGGRIVFAGEPSRTGDRLASIPKWGAEVAAPVWRALLRIDSAPAATDGERCENDDHGLEHLVDIHAFAPSELIALARRGGFKDIKVRGEELVANWFGWFNRSLEARADPEQVPMLWRQYAFHGYLALQRLDHHVLEPRLPPAIFYNLLLAARKSG